MTHRFGFFRAPLKASIFAIYLFFAATCHAQNGTALSGIVDTKLWRDFEAAVATNSLRPVQAAELRLACRTAIEPLVPEANLLNACMKAAVSLLDEPAGFVDVETYRRAELIKALPKGALGLDLRLSSGKGEPARIVGIRPDSPAARASLELGDIVLAIDGKNTTNADDLEILQALRGPIGSNAKLSLKKVDGSTAELALVRDELKPIGVHQVTLDDGISYLQISSFRAPYGAQLAQSVTALAAQGTRRIIIDIRGNMDGSPEEAAIAISQFCEVGDHLWTLEARSHRSVVKCDATGSKIADKAAVAVLVNEKTAGSAELFAMGLRDRGAQLVGRKTYGLAAFSRHFSLDGRAAVYFATEAVLNTRAERFAPLEPGVYAPNPSPTPYSKATTDLGLARAVELLTSTALQQDRGKLAEQKRSMEDSIGQRILFTQPVRDRPTAIVEVQLRPNGHVASYRLLQPSGARIWDNAVLEALALTPILPVSADLPAPPIVRLSFSPR